MMSIILLLPVAISTDRSTDRPCALDMCNTARSFTHQSNTYVFGFWFLVCYAATQLATQLRQRCIQVVRSNKEARKRLTESNGTPAMDLGHLNVVWKQYFFNVLFYDCCLEVYICIRRNTNKR